VRIDVANWDKRYRAMVSILQGTTPNFEYRAKLAVELIAKLRKNGRPDLADQLDEALAGAKHRRLLFEITHDNVRNVNYSTECD